MDPDDWLGQYVFDVDGAKLRLTFAMVSGRPEVVGFELWSADPRSQPWRKNQALMRDADNNFDVRLDRPISSSDLRTPLHPLVDEWMSRRKGLSGLILDSPQASAAWKRKVRKAQKQLETAAPPRPGRKPVYGRDHFEQVAQVYKQALRRRKPPTKTVAEWPDWGPVDISTAAKWVSRARNEFGFLPPTTQGKPASEKTSKKGRRIQKR
jgi:hypothetical protein